MYRTWNGFNNGANVTDGRTSLVALPFRQDLLPNEPSFADNFLHEALRSHLDGTHDTT